MKQLTVTFTPAAQPQGQTLAYNDVVDWSWDTEHGLRINLENDVKVLLNTAYILAVVETDLPDPEQAELWDLDEDLQSLNTN